jgi:hypothetical protein
MLPSSLYPLSVAINTSGYDVAVQYAGELNAGVHMQPHNTRATASAALRIPFRLALACLKLIKIPHLLISSGIRESETERFRELRISANRDPDFSDLEFGNGFSGNPSSRVT